MRQDLDRLMQERGLAGMIVLALDRYSPAMYYAAGQRIHYGIYFRAADGRAYLVHDPMERDQAEAVGCDHAAFEQHGIPTVLYLGTSESPIPAYHRSRQVGKATSWTWSPTLKKVISLGVVAKEHADTGSRLEIEWTVEGVHERVGATVVELPFFDPPRKRT